MVLAAVDRTVLGTVNGRRRSGARWHHGRTFSRTVNGGRSLYLICVSTSPATKERRRPGPAAACPPRRKNRTARRQRTSRHKCSETSGHAPICCIQLKSATHKRSSCPLLSGLAATIKVRQTSHSRTAAICYTAPYDWSTN